MKVLYVTLSSTLGGGPEHIYRLLQRTDPDTLTPYIAAPRSKPYWDRYASLVGEKRMLALPVRRLTLAAFTRLALFTQKHGIHLVHSHGKGAGIYGRLLACLPGLACVHTYHGLHLPPGRLQNVLYRRLERVLGHVTAAAIAVSPGEYENILALGFCRRSRLFHIANGVIVEQTVCPPETLPPFRIVHCSRFDPVQKNSEALVPIALALKARGLGEAVQFVLLGQGERLPALQEAIQSARCETMFQILGFHPDPRQILRGAGCYLSTSRWEGLPLAVLEAMAEGVPVVASDVVGNRDAVRHGETGWLFPLHQPAMAADWIGKLLHDAGLRQQLGVQAHARALHAYNIQSMASQILALYRRLGA